MRSPFAPALAAFALAFSAVLPAIPASAATDWSNAGKAAPVAPAPDDKQMVNEQTVIVAQNASPPPAARIELPDGRPAEPESLPSGYAWRDDGGIETPQGVFSLFVIFDDKEYEKLLYILNPFELDKELIIEF